MADFRNVYAFTLDAEKGYQCDPHDDGNWSSGKANVGRLIGTKGGISAPILIKVRGPQVKKADMQNLTTQEIVSIAKAEFYDPIQGDTLPAGIDLMVFDMDYNSGSEGHLGLERVLEGGSTSFYGITQNLKSISVTAAKILQAHLRVFVDGQLGPQSIQAILNLGEKASIVVLMANLHGEYLRYYKSCRNFSRYGKNWTERNDLRLAAALKLVTT